jgi:hypothetical protein
MDLGVDPICGSLSRQAPMEGEILELTVKLRKDTISVYETEGHPQLKFNNEFTESTYVNSSSFISISIPITSPLSFPLLAHVLTGFVINSALTILSSLQTYMLPRRACFWFKGCQTNAIISSELT